MSLQSAVAFLKSVPDISRDTYAFHDGWAYAWSPAILAAHPVPHMLGTFGLRASELDRVVARMGEEPTIEAGDGAIILKRGRLRSSIDLLDVDPPVAQLHNDEEKPAPLPDGLMDALKKVLPFMSRKGTWQKSIELNSGAVRAVSTSCVCEVDVPALDLATTVLTDDAALYLASRDAPIGWRELPGALAFFWESGAWMRCQLCSYSWDKALVDEIFKLAQADCPVAVTSDWREAFADVAALGEGNVDVTPRGIVGKTLSGKHVAEFETGISAPSRWDIEALANVIGVAEAWAPDGDGPAPFRGPGCRGVISRIRMSR